MRILHLADRLTSRGGAHQHRIAIAAQLAERGHEVHVAGGGGDAGHARDGEGAGVRHLVPGLDARGEAPVPALEALVATLRPDVVHLHTIVNPWVLEWAAHRPALITVQDHRYFCPAQGKWTRKGDVCGEPMSESLCAGCFETPPYFREILALTSRRLSAIQRLTVVVLSRYMQRELAAVGLRGPSVHVIPPFVHGLDPNAVADGAPAVLFVGRLAEHKGARDALAAWRESRVELPLLVAGTGPLRDEMERGGAQVLGWLDRRALSRAYRRASAVLMPSRWQEPFGIAGLEALSMGVPVVAWESGGIAEWHPGPLAAWGDLEALARGLPAAVGTRAAPRDGFEARPLMERLLEVYRAVAGAR